MAKILISIDHKWRDLPANMYIGMLLEKLGHDVEIVRHGYEPYYVVAKKPDMVLMIHLNDPQKQAFALELKKQGVLVVLMPTEGIPTFEGMRRRAAGTFDDLSGVDINFCWSDSIRGVLKENSTINEDNIITIGCPRFDFYRYPLSGIAMKKEGFCHKYGLHVDFPVVTFATNFTQAGFYTKNQDFLERDAEKLCYADDTKRIFGSLRQTAKRDYESRELLLHAFIRLVNEFEKVNFVLKLHPSEEHLFYYQLLGSELAPYRDRVAVISKAYIWDILSVTDVELVRSCTTGVESWMMGKPTIEMKLNPDEWYFSPDFASGSFIADSYGVLKKKLQSYLSGEVVSDELAKQREKFIATWCYKVDGKRSEAVVNVLADLLQKSSVDKKIRFNFKKWFIWLLLSITDYRVHDLKIYGLSMFSKSRVDKLGRIDKFINRKDIVYWRKLFNRIGNAQ